MKRPFYSGKDNNLGFQKGIRFSTFFFPHDLHFHRMNIMLRKDLLLLTQKGLQKKCFFPPLPALRMSAAPQDPGPAHWGVPEGCGHRTRPFCWSQCLPQPPVPPLPSSLGAEHLHCPGPSSFKSLSWTFLLLIQSHRHQALSSAIHARWCHCTGIN